MGLDNFIETAMNSVLKNPIVSVLRDINFMKYSSDSYKKDVYYRLLKNGRYNWRKLLLLTSVKLLSKTCAFAKSY